MSEASRIRGPGRALDRRARSVYSGRSAYPARPAESRCRGAAAVAAPMRGRSTQVHSAALLALLVGTPALVRAAPALLPISEEDVIETVLERRSKLPFPVSFAIPGVDPASCLAGRGLHTETFFDVKVYAVGHYVESTGAAEALAKWKGVKHAQLAKQVKQGLVVFMPKTIAGEGLPPQRAKTD